MKIKLIGLAVALTFSGAFAEEMAHDHSAHHENHDEKSEGVNESKKDHIKMEMTPEMKAHANEVYNTYLTIAEALASDDYAAAKKGVMALVKASESVSEEHKKSENHKTMMSLIHSMHGASDIESLRSSFQKFSEAFIDHMKTHKMALSKDFKVFYCPMKKARWVQDKSETKNPYYGAKMLTCGGLEK